ncbi:MAG: helix-turn-helix domain-containing protein [Bifidobacteriaceae bacterium]|jgi:excisionase family DNA binding protein|nr:helix-turn-helix domain-containing protein [Bifidobacteriaceae bacterium]
MTTTLLADGDRTQDTVLPPPDRAEVENVSQFLATHHRQARLTAPDGTSTPIPGEVFAVLVTVVKALAQGAAVTVAPVSMRLTTSQAAQMLGISRPTLVRLLEDGEIPCEQPHRHRMLRLEDVLAFQRRRRATQRAVRPEATQQAVADSLHQDNVEGHTEALRKARHETH